MTQEQMAQVMEAVFEECRSLRGAGQAEYAHRDENTFANFERVAERIDEPREKVLLTYMEKHIDGIHSWVKGHRSQRENVRGRINDAIVYLCLLRGMVEEVEELVENYADADPYGIKMFVAGPGSQPIPKLEFPPERDYVTGAPFPGQQRDYMPIGHELGRDGKIELIKDSLKYVPFVTGLQKVEERRPTILVDVDGVTADLLPAWLAAWNKDQPSIKNVTVDRITKWDLTDVCPGIHDYLTAELYNKVQPVPGSQLGVRELRKLGRVVFVTSVARDTAGAKVDWLNRHGFIRGTHGWADDLVMTRNKELIPGDIIIDDYPENLEKASVIHDGKILVDHPYNRDETRFCRAKNWDEIIAHVQDIVGFLATAQ